MSKGLIFVVDDDIALQAILKASLEAAGYTVLMASDGDLAEQTLRNINPITVICDIMMPVMDGTELFQHIKHRLEEDCIPIIIMTALNRKPWFADLEAEGAVIIQKPFEVNRLIELLDVILE